MLGHIIICDYAGVWYILSEVILSKTVFYFFYETVEYLGSKMLECRSWKGGEEGTWEEEEDWWNGMSGYLLPY